MDINGRQWVRRITRKNVAPDIAGAIFPVGTCHVSPRKTRRLARNDDCLSPLHVRRMSGTHLRRRATDSGRLSLARFLTW